MRHLSLSHLAALAVSVAALSGTTGCRGWQSDAPPVHLNWNMDTQEKGKAYRKSDFFADGRMMRTPPAGTVAQGFLKEDDHKSLGLIDGEPATSIPEIGDPATAVKRGQERFNIYCAPCHGGAGDGGGPVNDKLTIKAPSFHDARLKEMPAGKIYQAILNGVNGGNMASYAAQVPEDDRWNIIMYVRALQKSRDPSVTLGGVAVAKAAADATPEQKGEALFKAKGCNACHSLDGTKVVGPTFQGLFGKKEKTNKGDVVVDEAYLVESILKPMEQVADGFPPAMPPLPLTDEEVQQLIAYIKTIK
jgi:mono/diheme cytochrome c family protein